MGESEAFVNLLINFAALLKRICCRPFSGRDGAVGRFAFPITESLPDPTMDSRGSTARVASRAES